ncbi:MAG: RNase adapter RapZ [Pseudomonadota bacterium]|nr:RNase adapter RapZ [Pseudomonadota bacterium]
MKLIVLSGLSGAGKSVALHMLEDLGYYCIDNIPVSLLEPLIDDMRDDKFQTLTAVGIDSRSRVGDTGTFGERIGRFRNRGIEVETLFLQADPEIIIKRYSETRRRHPLSDRQTPLAEAIERERTLLHPIAEQADMVIDTSRKTVHELRDLIRDRVHGREGLLSLLFQSFGFKHGIPTDADFVFDIRCLPNPHWQPDLRAMTGKDQAVVDYLNADPLAEEMYQDIRTYLERWLPRFESENRSYMTVAIGCTGGQHRSVYFVERLATDFARHQRRVLIRHTELP